MHAVVRMYSGSGANELFDVLERHKSEIEKRIKEISSLVSFIVVRGGEGGFSVTVCKDKVGADESVTAARDWIAANAANTGAAAPRLLEGTVIIYAE